MKKIIVLLSVALSVCLSVSAFAGAQQDKMRGCSVEAKGMKGQERKDFMKKCLKKDYVLKSATTAKVAEKSVAKTEVKPVVKSVEKPVASAAPVAAPVKQQDKMKSCNADAKTKALKGQERKDFMKSCLKG
jgi:hypothetical protein